MKKWQEERNYRRVRSEGGEVIANIITVDGMDVEVPEDVYLAYEDKKQRHREFALCRYMLYASYKPLTRYLLFCPVGVNGRRHTLPERS